MMAGGCSQNQVAVRLGINEDTLYDWVKRYSHFSGCLARGKMAAKAFFEDQIIDNLDNARYNTNLLKFAMANRFGWSDKVEQKQSFTVNVNHTEITNNVVQSLPESMLKMIGSDRTSKTLEIEEKDD